MAVKTNRSTNVGTRKKRKRKPDHMAALDIPYDRYIEINGGEFCGICGAKPKTKRLDRDHEHKGKGRPRGLLCHRCNRALPNYITTEWLNKAWSYLER